MVFSPDLALTVPWIHMFLSKKVTCPEFQTMILFSDCMSHTLTILDDIEMYEKHKPFALGNFVTLSTVINQFLFKAIWSNLILDTTSPLFISLHSLLSVLYRRDNRRPFTRPNHWLIKDIKAKELIRWLIFFYLSKLIFEGCHWTVFVNNVNHIFS